MQDDMKPTHKKLTQCLTGKHGPIIDYYIFYAIRRVSMKSFMGVFTYFALLPSLVWHKTGI